MKCLELLPNGLYAIINKNPQKALKNREKIGAELKINRIALCRI